MTKYDTEVWSLASMLVGKHGVRATTFATHQALKARSQGETSRMETWQQIADAANEILSSDPDLVPR
jgi:hypothetical protein